MQNLIVYQENRPLESFVLEQNGLVVTGSPSITEWLQAGEALKQAEGAVQWWIGDWLNYGEFAYGEMYAQALDESQKKTWQQYKWVASKVESSIRIELLHWAHHQIVAPLEQEEQIYWLDKASEGDGEKPWSVATLRAAIKDSKNGSRPTWIKYTDVWNITAPDGRFGIDYPGRIPGQVVLNILHYYTKEGDLIIDPMAGGGVTVDACEYLNRRCIAFDYQPARNDIVFHDATQVWPISDMAQLVFIDPPYWSQMESDYGIMASQPYPDYLADMTKVFDNAYGSLVEGGIMTVLIAPMAIKGDYKDIPFDFVQRCLDIDFSFLRRVSVPVSSQQIGPQVMEHCRDNKIMAALIRDLLVFQK